jgi:hypothetical protein
MSDYTPTTDEVRSLYVTGTPPHRVTVPEGNAEFDRWLAQHDAEQQQKGVRLAAEHLRNEMEEPWSMRFASHLDAHAAGIVAESGGAA